MQDSNPTKSLYVKGTSGIGKTEYLKSLALKHYQPYQIARVGSIDQLEDEYHNETALIILDDVSFDKIKTREQIIQLLEIKNARSIDIKHSKVNINPNVKTIILSNLPPEATLKFFDPAIQRRLTVIDLGDKPLYLTTKITKPTET